MPDLLDLIVLSDGAPFPFQVSLPIRYGTEYGIILNVILHGINLARLAQVLSTSTSTYLLGSDLLLLFGLLEGLKHSMHPSYGTRYRTLVISFQSISLCTGSSTCNLCAATSGQMTILTYLRRYLP